MAKIEGTIATKFVQNIQIEALKTGKPVKTLLDHSVFCYFAWGEYGVSCANSLTNLDRPLAGCQAARRSRSARAGHG
jgi:hypothetical protein